MEELVGKLWHKLISRAADTEHAQAAVELEQIRVAAGVMFRALGGDGGLRIEPATATEHASRRRWLQRIAGSGRMVELAWRDGDTLRLPPRIALFPDQALNRDLFLWLAALAAGENTHASLPRAWLARSQALTRQLLDRYPGLKPRYQRLCAAQLALRPELDSLPPDERRQEEAIRQALREPGSIAALPPAAAAPQPVHLWLHPSPPLQVAASRATDDDGAQPGESRDGDERKRRAEQVQAPQRKGGLLTLRMENLLTWGEFANLDRTEEEDDRKAENAAEDLDTLSISRDRRTLASRLRFDLDLPTAGYDDIPLGEGILLPEWDYKQRALRRDYCRLQPMVAREASPCPLPPHLRRTAGKLRRQFEALVHTRTWLRAQPDGSEIDLNAYLDYATARHTGHASQEQGLYRDFRTNQRDLACLLLADLSLSTDAAVNNDAKVIDVIRDSLYLFSEALAAAGDRFAMYGFSSRHRDHVRFHTLKEFDQSYDAATRGRIEAIRPGYYTRMGAALRQASRLLEAQRAGRQLLLLLTDGKPNDLDHYEGRYGIEDTRQALHEARQQGLQPFCVTIDRRAGDYLPHLFGPGNYVVIRRPAELPRQLPQLYARLTT